LRWPDGRTRPLLVDGAPIMPSGVFVDESGQLHVGRDAQRLAGLDPSRFEPNPKRRIDEPGVLLGNREVATIDLLAALLGAVARAAVEAVGFLPAAVLTHPAAWGPRRREALAAAAARAGWPPVRLVPEPVAAARYFVEVLRRPVPVGASLAVFDFGGGTLDVAVVRNDHGRFTVLGSGGIEDLGGLDVDAALVEHLGGVLSQTATDTWAALARPETTSQRRDRRLFWEDVRGAKEMLSRTAVAPITIPGRDQAMHLTREELERIVQPLMRRAVWETGAVIQRCGLRPDQLAGLFLVGGSSRLPIAGRLLHAELGIAPTVLEQPELPVAEGALAELVPPVQLAGAAGPGVAPGAAATGVYRSSAIPVSTHPAAPMPVSSPPPVSGMPASPPPMSAMPVSPVPTSPPAPPPFPVGPPHPPMPGRRSWLQRPVTWIAAGVAAVLVVAVVAAFVLFKLNNGVSAVDFKTLSAGVSVDMGEASNVDGTATATLGDRAYYGWTADKAFHLGALDVAGDKKLWGPVTVDFETPRWRLFALPGQLVALADASSGPGALYVFDTGNGRERFHIPFEDRDRVYFFDDVLVIHQYTTKELRGLDWTNGGTKWTRPNPKDSYGGNDALMATESFDGDQRGPAALSGYDTALDLGASKHRLVQLGYDKKIYLVDAKNGKSIRSWNGIGDSYSKYFAHDGKFYITADSPYRIQAIDLDKQDEPQTVYSAKDAKRNIEALVACGAGRVCVLDMLSSDEKTAEIVTIDVNAHKELWRKPAAGADALVPMGDQVLATSVSGASVSYLYTADGSKQLLKAEDQKTRGARVNAGSLLFFAGELGTYGNNDISLIGVKAADGSRVSVGPLQKVRGVSCSWNEYAIVCGTATKIQVWRFADP
jgi:hypothetical protein